MTLIALCSAKGAPGVTTTAMALTLAWPAPPIGRVLLVDADPAGSDLATGYLQGAAPPGAGVAAFAAARDDLRGATLDAAVALDAGASRLVLTGRTPLPRPVAGAELPWVRARELTHDPEDPWDVLVDVGRVTSPVEASMVLAAADVVVLVMGSSLRAVASARQLVAAFRADSGNVDSDDRVRLLVAGERRPYPVDEIAAALSLPKLPAMAWDPRTAGVLSDGDRADRWFARSRLMRSAAAVASALCSADESPSTTDEVGRGAVPSGEAAYVWASGVRGRE